MAEEQNNRDTEVFEFTFPKETRPSSIPDLLNIAPDPVRTSASVSRILSSNYYVYGTDNVDAIVDCLNDFSSLLAIGVVDKNKKPMGVIIRRELFNILGKSYGKDFVENQSAADIMRITKSFHEGENIYGVSGIISEEMKDQEIRYFTSFNAAGEFSGVFSTRDVLIYLANLTRTDIEMARVIQSRIVKEDDTFDNDYFTVLCHNSMAMGVGGDFYLLKNYHQNRYNISIADVSGKGVSASLITGIACGMAQSYNFNRGLTRFVSDLNTYILQTFNSEKFMTGIFMDLDCEKAKLRLCDMGHSSIIFHRGKNFCSFKDQEINFPLGITPLDTINSGTLTLQSGDLIVISTDGIAEQINPLGEQYGDHRLKEMVRTHAHATPKELRDAILHDVHSFRDSQPQKDDLTFLIFRWK